MVDYFSSKSNHAQKEARSDARLFIVSQTSNGTGSSTYISLAPKPIIITQNRLSLQPFPVDFVECDTFGLVNGIHQPNVFLK